MKETKLFLKKIIWGIIGFFVIISLYAWYNKKVVETTQEVMLDYVDAFTETTTIVNEKELKSLAKFSNSKAFILSDNINGVVYLEYKNTSGDITSFDKNYKLKAYQNGIELERPFYINDSKYQYFDNKTKNIKNDVSIPIEQAFTLENTEDDIEVDIYYSPNVYSSNDTLIETIVIPITQDQDDVE